MNVIHRIVTITIVVTILITIFLEVAILLDLETIKGYNFLGWGYLFIYFLYPLIIAGFIALGLHFILKSKSISGLKNLRWEFFLVVSQILVIIFSSRLNEYLAIDNKIQLVVSNKSDHFIGPINIHGRHESIQIDTLEPNKNKMYVYFGRNIDYGTRNNFENVIIMDYKKDNDWKSLTVVDMYGVISDSLTITFEDSVKVDIK